MAGELPFSVDRVATWLSERGLCSGPLTVQPIGDGHSNLIYAVSDGTRSMVLRRPPPPPFPPGGYDVLREARLLSALSGTAVPVPHVLAVAEAGEVMDVPFYLMEYLDGEVATTRLPGALDVPAERSRVGEALVDALAALHAVDWRTSGLGTNREPERFLERQLDRLPRLIEEGGTIPAPFRELREELRAALPVSGPPAIIHGDLRLGNVMLSREAPARILGVLDWELSAVGDPLVDVGYTLATYAVPDEPLHVLTALSKPTLAAGFPTRAELAERYARASGRDLSHLLWYQAFALWKLAVLFEFQRRQGGDPFYSQPGNVEGLLAAARRTLESHLTRLPVTLTREEP